MKNDEFAFFNQQLAAMVRDGIPLEAALRRLCADMRAGKLRTELEKLEADLAKGIPLREAARARDLPDLYKQMLEVGAQSNDLPAILTMLADHYQRRHVIATRLKGLMVYPAIVLCGAFLLACFFGILASVSTRTFDFRSIFQWGTPPSTLGIWIPPILLALAVVILLWALNSRRIQRRLRWKLPAFKEASIAQLASSLAVMLKSGVALNDAFGLVRQLEHGTPAEAELAGWQRRLADGKGKFPEIAGDGTLFPPLFIWTVGQSREDLPTGFQRAADIYTSRASYRSDLLLYSALPISILALALVILGELKPVVGFFIYAMQMLGDDGKHGRD